MKQTFKTKMSTSVKLITISVHFLVFITSFLPLITSDDNNISIIVSLCIFFFLFLIFGLVFLLRPFQYIIDDEQLIVRKYILPKKIKFEAIESVDFIDISDLKILFRLWGSGGLWGWFGYFSTRSFKVVNMQCTEKENLIMIKIRDEKPLVLSPTDSKLFHQQLNKQLLVSF